MSLQSRIRPLWVTVGLVATACGGAVVECPAERRLSLLESFDRPSLSLSRTGVYAASTPTRLFIITTDEPIIDGKAALFQIELGKGARLEQLARKIHGAGS